MLTYAEQLRHPFWQRRRLEIMKLDNFLCLDCGSGVVTLNVHHKWYIPGLMAWEYEDDMLETLCENCHLKRHKKEVTIIGEILYEYEPGTLIDNLRNKTLNINGSATVFDAENLKKSLMSYITQLSINKKIDLVNIYCLISTRITGPAQFTITTNKVYERDAINSDSVSFMNHLIKYFNQSITFKTVANEEIKITA